MLNQAFLYFLQVKQVKRENLKYAMTANKQMNITIPGFMMLKADIVCFTVPGFPLLKEFLNISCSNCDL